MTVDMLVSVFILLAMFGFFALSLRKAYKFAHMQIHARLDLYPVPKEGGGRAAYGGSYLEEPEWWTKPRKIDRVNEAVDIMKEMLFIKKLFVHQRVLWWASYSMHLGIYVMLGWSVLLLVSVAWHPDWYVLAVTVVGVVGFALSTVGCVLLLVRRVSDRRAGEVHHPARVLQHRAAADGVAHRRVLVAVRHVALRGGRAGVHAERHGPAAHRARAPGAAGHHVPVHPAFQDEPLRGQVLLLPQGAVGQRSQPAGSSVERRFEDAAAHPAHTGWSAAKQQAPTSESSKG